MSVNTSRLFCPRNFRISSLSLGCAASAFVTVSRVQKVPVDLSVQVITVRHDHEREIAGLLPENFAGVENHREALARTLRVPEHTELPFNSSRLKKRLIGTGSHR